ncbi:MAG: type II secretion system protein M [Deltaproteobacteria bacterium]|nr:type II secretion system protein M [Deltaproteobacteria bacterium]
MTNININRLDQICISLVIIVSLICGYWVAKTTFKQRWQLRQENEIISKAIIELKSAKENFENLNVLLKDTKTELEFLDKRIPRSVNIGQVLKEIDLLMKDRNILLVSLQPLPPVEEKLYTKIPIRLMFEGSFASIYNLLYDLETMNRMLVAEDMSISRRNLDEKCHAVITASVYQRLKE